MAPNIIFTDGFDTYTTVLDKWDVNFTPGFSQGPTPVINQGVGRGGAGALAVGPVVGNGDANATAYVSKNVGAQVSIFLGFAFNWNPSVQNIDSELVRFMDGGTCQCSLWITSSGVLYFARGGATGTQASIVPIGAPTSSSYPSNSFHYIEVGVSISSTVGTCVLRVDQNVLLNLSGLNNQGSTNSTFSSVTFGTGFVGSGHSGFNSFSALFDDIYFDLNQFDGDNRIQGLLPSGNGTTQNFTNFAASWAASTVTNLFTTIVDSNGNLQRATAVTGDQKTGGSVPTWATGLGATTTDNHVTWTNLGAETQYNLVNEQNPDGDSSYIFDNVVNDISRFTFPAISGSTIICVNIWAFARKDDGGARTIQGALKSAGTLGTTGTDVALGSNYQYLLLQSTTDPHTGLPWTVAGLNAAELGIKITN